MIPLWSTILSSVFLLVGAGAVISALIIQGRDKIVKPKLYIILHRYFGWTYFILFIIVLVFMLARIEEYWEEAEARIAIHIALAVGLLFLLLIKVTVPRFFPRLNKNLFPLGLLVYAFGFTLVNITAGYYIIRKATGTPYIAHATGPHDVLDTELGKQLFITKCSICHELNQILINRSPESWEKIVNNMVQLAEPRIGPDEAKQILHFLIETHVPQPVAPAPDATPVQLYCTPCHSLQDVYSQQYSREGWTQIVQQMNAISAEIVPGDKISSIVDYLMEQQTDAVAENAVPDQ